jgi:hypothetical protein
MQWSSLAVFFAVQCNDHGLAGVVCSGVCWNGYGMVLLLLLVLLLVLLLGASVLGGGVGGTARQSLCAPGT